MLLDVQIIGKIRCLFFCMLRDPNPGGYPESALTSSSFPGVLSVPALHLAYSR